MPKSNSKNEIYMGMVLMGATGLAMGFVVHSPLLMTIAGILGLVVGGFVGWIGGRRYMFIICLGILIGAFFGYRTGDQDILIIAAGSGGAIAGFIGAQIEQFFTTGRGGIEQ
jgi:energy-coupling factor transporter transmembrane protein EcfT